MTAPPPPHLPLQRYTAWPNGAAGLQPTTKGAADLDSYYLGTDHKFGPS